MLELEKIFPLTLEEILNGEDGREDFLYLRNLIRAHIFSRYPERRILAKQQLEEYWQRKKIPINLLIIREQDIISAFVEFHNSDKYVLVEQYTPNCTVLEEV